VNEVAILDLIRGMDPATTLPPELVEFMSSSHTPQVRIYARSKLACLLAYQKASLPAKHEKTMLFLLTYLGITMDSWQQRNISDLVLRQMSPEWDCKLLEVMLRKNISPYVRSHVFRQLSLVLKKAVTPCYKEAARKLESFIETQAVASK
jgi:hypothetical protein